MFGNYASHFINFKYFLLFELWETLRQQKNSKFVRNEQENSSFSHTAVTRRMLGARNFDNRDQNAQGLFFEFLGWAFVVLHVPDMYKRDSLDSTLTNNFA